MYHILLCLICNFQNQIPWKIDFLSDTLDGPASNNENGYQCSEKERTLKSFVYTLHSPFLCVPVRYLSNSVLLILTFAARILCITRVHDRMVATSILNIYDAFQKTKRWIVAWPTLSGVFGLCGVTSTGTIQTYNWRVSAWLLQDLPMLGLALHKNSWMEAPGHVEPYCRERFSNIPWSAAPRLCNCATLGPHKSSAGGYCSLLDHGNKRKYILQHRWFSH